MRPRPPGPPFTCREYLSFEVLDTSKGLMLAFLAGWSRWSPRWSQRYVREPEPQEPGWQQ
jgi:hypothetical protein